MKRCPICEVEINSLYVDATVAKFLDQFKSSSDNSNDYTKASWNRCDKFPEFVTINIQINVEEYGVGSKGKKKPPLVIDL